MKIAISAAGPSLDSQVDPRFGRCQYLLIVDADSFAFEALENPAMTSPGGAGIQAAEFVVSTGADAVITGNCGPNAYQVLSAAHIDVLDGVSGSVREAVENYQRGELKAAAGPSGRPHSGMGPSMGSRMGSGWGRGMGGGRSGGPGGDRRAGPSGGRSGGPGGGRRVGPSGGRSGGSGGGRAGGMGGGRGGGRRV
jgi:predicted Fe-Mo cluster-binding NifX family protein